MHSEEVLDCIVLLGPWNTLEILSVGTACAYVSPHNALVRMVDLVIDLEQIEGFKVAV